MKDSCNKLASLGDILPDGLADHLELFKAAGIVVMDAIGMCTGTGTLAQISVLSLVTEM